MIQGLVKEILLISFLAVWLTSGLPAMAQSEADWWVEFLRDGGCDSTDARFAITAPGGLPVDEGDLIHIEGTAEMGPQTQVIVVSACFYEDEVFLGEVQQMDHTVVIDTDTYLRGDITALSYGSCYPCLFANSMKVIIATSIGGIPPLYIWSSDGQLPVHYNGVIPTPTPLIPATSGTGIMVMLVVITGILIASRVRGW